MIGLVLVTLLAVAGIGTMWCCSLDENARQARLAGHDEANRRLVRTCNRVFGVVIAACAGVLAVLLGVWFR